MASPAPTRPQPSANATPPAPLRGTQSFVAVMASTWRRPGLTALEVLWRWMVGAPFLWLVVRSARNALRAHPVNVAALGAMTVFQPTAAIETIHQQFSPWLPPLLATSRWLLPLGIAAWVVASTAGRLVIWRRLDPALSARPAAVAALGLSRLMLLLGFLGAWAWGIAAAAHSSIAAAVSAGGEPNLVLFTTVVVVLTLLLFLLWCVVVWLFDAAPLFVLAGGQGVGESLRSALHAHLLRSKLIEINLVMGIVKVGLAVLAMVFSATPLPFAAEETQTFLVSWWIFVGVLLLFALDFFHVVRRAANLAFFQTLVTPKNDTLSPRERAY